MEPEPYDVIKGLLAENFVYLSLRRRIENGEEIAGIVPWFASYEKINGELNFYVSGCFVVGLKNRERFAAIGASGTVRRSG